MIRRLHSQFSRAARFRKLAVALAALCLIALATVSLRAESWEQKDWTQWDSQECYLIMRGSPWMSQGPTLHETYVGSLGELGHREMIPYAVFVSSLVVRQALVRQAQLDRHYNQLNPVDKQQFDQMSAACLGLDLHDRFVLRIGPFLEGNPPKVRIEARSGNIDQIGPSKQNAIAPCPFYDESSWPAGKIRPNYDHEFPRVLNGQSAIQPDEKRVKIWEFKFNATKMIYKGRLDY